MPTHELDEFVNREKELALIEEKVSRLAKGEPFAPYERVVHFIGPSGMGKSCLLEKLHNVLSNELSCIPMLIKLETLRDEHDGFIKNLIQFIYEELSRILERDEVFLNPSESTRKSASVFVRTINLSIPGKTLVLLLDEINILQRKELEDIEEYFLEGLIHDNPRAVIITAGRSPARLNDFALRPKPENTVVLPAFDEKTTGDQVERLRQGSGQLAGKIHDLGNGVPGNTKKLVVHIVGDPPSIQDDLQAVRSLIMDIKQDIEEYFHPVIEAICILPDFIPEDVIPMLSIHPALGKKWEETKIKEVFYNLKQIQIGPGALINWGKDKNSWVMDEPTRALFERELKLRDPELWGKLHCVAYQMYKNWGEDFSSQLYKDKATYHQQCLQSAGMNCDDLGHEG